jgi:S1-C subfamily serine protease
LAIAAFIAAAGIFLTAQQAAHHRLATSDQSPRESAMAAVDPLPTLNPALVDSSKRGTESSLSHLPRPLHLFTTSPAGDSRESTAAIGTDSANPQTYEVGAILANGAVLEEIHADRVVLSLDGNRTTLSVNGSVPRVDAAAFVSGPNGKDAIDALPTSREHLSAYLRPQFVFDGSGINGLRIFPGLQPGGLELLGLEPADIIRSVGGKPLNDDTAWGPIDAALSAGKSITVTVERRSGLLFVVLEGDRLVQAAIADRNRRMPALASGS